nr:MAG TPA: hypothetical protein [Caudoviricetes sp.]
MKEIQRTLKDYILKRLDTKTGIRSSKDIAELIYAYIELEYAQQGMVDKPEAMSKIEVDKAGVRIQGKRINVNNEDIDPMENITGIIIKGLCRNMNKK